jgi:hypothetical protein
MNNSWSSEEKLKQLKNSAFEQLIKESLKNDFAYICITQACGHCNEFKKNNLDKMKTLLGNTSYKLCDVGTSDYYRNILTATGCTHVPTILWFSNGIVKNYSPDQFINILSTQK